MAAVKEITTGLSRLTSVRQSVAEWQRQQLDHQHSTQTDLLSTHDLMTLTQQVHFHMTPLSSFALHLYYIVLMSPGWGQTGWCVWLEMGIMHT